MERWLIRGIVVCVILTVGSGWGVAAASPVPRQLLNLLPISGPNSEPIRRFNQRPIICQDGAMMSLSD